VKKRRYRTLKNALDRVFSEWVRRRWSRYDGTASCVTCGVVKPWAQLQCGHFVSRVHLAARWNEFNGNPQCPSCNVLRRGNPAEYALWLTRKYGPKIIEDLVVLKHQTVKYNRSDLEEMIRQYEQRLENLDAASVGAQAVSLSLS